MSKEFNSDIEFLNHFSNLNEKEQKQTIKELGTTKDGKITSGTQEPKYKTIIWAEENGPLNANNSEWSFGNGSVGNIGIVLSESWNISHFGFNSETFTDKSEVQIIVTDYRESKEITSFIISKQNYSEKLKETVQIPEGAVLGFKTGKLSGVISDCRISLTLTQF